MIDAGPSLMLAERLGRDGLFAYLSSAGWSQRPSRAAGFGIWSKTVDQRPVEFVLPTRSGVAEETRRVADALRTVAAVEGRDIEMIAEDAQLLAKPLPNADTDQDALEKRIGQAIDALFLSMEGSEAESTTQRDKNLAEDDIGEEIQKIISQYRKLRSG